jgi:hypothetical protein
MTTEEQVGALCKDVRKHKGTKKNEEQTFNHFKENQTQAPKCPPKQNW